jgi:GT2 family glycosyltransferase
MPKIDLSIIILNYNTSKLLRVCLRSVERADKGSYRVETMVVDNASSDDSVLMVKKEFPWVRLIKSRRNLGFAGGNNLALKKSKGRYFLFLNSDTKIKPLALRKVLDFMEGDRQIGAVTAKTQLKSGGMDPDCHRGFPTPWASLCYFLGLEKLFPRSRLFGQYHQFYLNLKVPHEMDAGFGTFMMVRRRVIDRVGSWDERYFFYGEDLDLFYRIKKAGWKVMFYPEVLLTHYKGASSGLRGESRQVSLASREIRLKTAKASIKAMEIFYRKFYQNKYPWWITWLVIAGIKVRGGLRLLYHHARG